MRKIIRLLLFFVVFWTVFNAVAKDRPMAEITVRVLSDDGLAVTGATICAGTFLRWIPGEGFGHDEDKIVKGVTDNNGLVSLKIDSLDGEVAYGVNPVAGFYDDGSHLISFTNSINGEWVPWNPSLEIVLKRKVNPIPLYARKVEVHILPESAPPNPILTALINSNEVTYDLLQGDWAAPYGQGKVADLIFKMCRKLKGFSADHNQLFEAIFTVTFTNPSDGIQPIFADPKTAGGLRLPRMAPADGYITNFVKKRTSEDYSQDGKLIRGDQNYFFRVRTKQNDDGKIISALYGKIHGEIKWDFMGCLQLTYYLNPTPNDRNLEFDPKKNLFQKLESVEQINAP